MTGPVAENDFVTVIPVARAVRKKSDLNSNLFEGGLKLKLRLSPTYPSADKGVIAG